MTMDKRWVVFDVVRVGRYLSSGVVKARFAELLRGWIQDGRPAILLSIDAEIPMAMVHFEDDLRAAFKDTPIIDVESITMNAPGNLLVFVYDGRETMGFSMADPRGMSCASRSDPLAARPTRASAMEKVLTWCHRLRRKKLAKGPRPNVARGGS